LTVRGAQVEHITGPGHANVHRLTPFAHVEGTRITYPSEDGSHLAARAPFHLEATVRVLQRRPTNAVDVWEDGRFQRLLSTANGLVLVEIKNEGTIDAPDVRLEVLQGERSSAVLAQAEAAMRRVLGLDIDPRPLQRLGEGVPQLRPTALALRG